MFYCYSGIPKNFPYHKFNLINAKNVRKTILKTGDGVGHLWGDADGWIRIHTLNQCGDHSTNLGKTLAEVIKKLRAVEDLSSLLEVFISCCLTSLDKNLGFQTKGIDEVYIVELVG